MRPQLSQPSSAPITARLHRGSCIALAARPKSRECSMSASKSGHWSRDCVAIQSHTNLKHEFFVHMLHQTFDWLEGRLGDTHNAELQILRTLKAILLRCPVRQRAQ